MKEKFLKLCENKEFVTKINSLESEKEVVEFLNANGIEVKSVAELNDMLQPGSEELDVDELNQASGGGVCFVVGAGLDANACWGDGKSMEDDSTRGHGAMFCLFVGIGMGQTTCGAEGGMC